jgi:hypothetical protein
MTVGVMGPRRDAPRPSWSLKSDHPRPGKIARAGALFLSGRNLDGTGRAEQIYFRINR